MKRLFFLAILMVVGGFGLQMYAQSVHPILQASRIPPRVEDHFWRRKVVNRIDLDEKINAPLREAEDLSLYTNSAHGETQGIISALINGLKSGKYLAYHPDSLTKSLTYDDVVKWAQEIEGGGDAGGDDWGTEDGGMDDFDAGGDLGGDDFGFEDEGGFDDLEGDTDPFGGAGAGAEDFSLAPFESVIEFIEDRIFDKNRSDMIYDIEFIRLVWVDIGETLPDKNFVVFRYSEVLETLEDTQWKNKFNDAEYRNLREIFELRLFNSVIFNVSGRGVKSLEEADFRRNQLVEFEHHLWSY
ncbi:MAG: hypothetical protein H6581_05680 [Bacteroidia bacterium]|nr:hypothetical protein [Bacteroidia bacterium]